MEFYTPTFEDAAQSVLNAPVSSELALLRDREAMRLGVSVRDAAELIAAYMFIDLVVEPEVAVRVGSVTKGE